MLAIFLVVLAGLGLLLNWPVFSTDPLRWLTQPLGEGHFYGMVGQFSSGFLRPDGIILGCLSFGVLVSAFFRTTRTLLNLRLVILVAINGLIGAELVMALKGTVPFYRFSGLAYAALFYLLALLASVFRVGSMKSLNSTFMGKPMSESRAFSQTFSQMWQQSAGERRLTLRFEDTVSESLRSGSQQEFSKREIKIGRDPSWSDLVVGENWPMVSGKHATIRTIGNAVVYEPIARRYAFAVDGRPTQAPRELRSGCQLSLVSGSGPRIELSIGELTKPPLRPKTLFRAGEIARDEFKRLRTTFKILIVFVILALPLLGGFYALQKRAAAAQLDQLTRESIEAGKRLEAKIGELEALEGQSRGDQATIDRLKREVNRLREEDAGTAADSGTDGPRRETSGVSSRSGVYPALERRAKVVDIKFTSQKVSIYFPVITTSGDERPVSGTAMFVKDSGQRYMLVSEGAKVLAGRRGSNGVTHCFIYPETWPEFARFAAQVQKGGTPRAELVRQIERYARQQRLLEISARRWRHRGRGHLGNAVVAAAIKDLPEYLVSYIPGLESSGAIEGPVYFYGFQDGKKIYGVERMVARGDEVIRIGRGWPLRFHGGFLVNIRSSGRYAVIGVAHSIGLDAGGSMVFMGF